MSLPCHLFNETESAERAKWKYVLYNGAQKYVLYNGTPGLPTMMNFCRPSMFNCLVIFLVLFVTR